MRQMESKSVIIFDIQLLADVEIIMEAIIIRIDDSHATIRRRYFQCFQEMPFGATKIVGFPVKEDAVGNKVKMVVPTADALVTPLQ